MARVENLVWSLIRRILDRSTSTPCRWKRSTGISRCTTSFPDGTYRPGPRSHVYRVSRRVTVTDVPSSPLDAALTRLANALYANPPPAPAVPVPSSPQLPNLPNPPIPSSPNASSAVPVPSEATLTQPVPVPGAPAPESQNPAAGTEDVPSAAGVDGTAPPETAADDAATKHEPPSLEDEEAPAPPTTRSKTLPYRKPPTPTPEPTPAPEINRGVVTLSDVHAAREVLAEKANAHWVKGLGGGQNKEGETIVNFLYKMKAGPGECDGRGVLPSTHRLISSPVVRFRCPPARRSDCGSTDFDRPTPQAVCPHRGVFPLVMDSMILARMPDVFLLLLIHTYVLLIYLRAIALSCMRCRLVPGPQSFKVAMGTSPDDIFSLQRDAPPTP